MQCKHCKNNYCKCLNTFSSDKSLKFLGTESTICVSCVMEPWTSRCIDFQATEKCFSCVNHNTPDTYCQKGLFHGPAGNMEAHNAIILFKRSLELGLRYIQFILNLKLKMRYYSGYQNCFTIYHYHVCEITKLGVRNDPNS